MNERAKTSDTPEGREPSAYEAPRVERVIDPAELEQEVLYAGANGVSGRPV